MRIPGWWPLVSALAMAIGVPQTPAQQPTFRSDSLTVAIYATVTAADGRLVPGLPQSEFEILDNGIPQAITVFSNAPQPVTIALMLDMSLSMRVNHERLRASASEFIAALGPGDRAAIGSFGEEIAVSPLVTGDRRELNRILREELWPGGVTPLWAGLYAGMEAIVSEPGRRVVLVLTDGTDVPLDRLGRRLPADVLTFARDAEFMIYAIGLEGTGLAANMAAVAAETGGGHFQVRRTDNLGSTFKRVADELHHQYLLGFSSQLLDGKVHTLQVLVRKPGMTVRGRTSYLASLRR